MGPLEFFYAIALVSGIATYALCKYIAIRHPKHTAILIPRFLFIVVGLLALIPFAGFSMFVIFIAQIVSFLNVVTTNRVREWLNGGVGTKD